MHFYHYDDQSERIEKSYRDYCTYAMSAQNKDTILNKLKQKDCVQYERICFAHALLHTKDAENIRVANSLIQIHPLVFCHFSPISLIDMYLHHAEQLTEESKDVILNYLQQHLTDHASETLDFVGVNDNFPMLHSFTTIVGGTICERYEIVKKGEERLGQLADLLKRRGSVSEFNSPHYIFIGINALALIAENAANEATKHLALQCEERLWAEALGHAIPDCSLSAGPFSRTYSPMFYETTDVTMILYFLLGDQSRLYPNADKNDRHKIAKPFLKHFPLSKLHCPAYLVEWYLSRTYPHEYSSTYEVNSSNDGLPNGKNRGYYFGAKDPGERDPYAEEDMYEYPAGDGMTVTYMDKNYSIGTCDKEWHNGLQSMNFYVNYKKLKEVNGLGDIGHVITKYIVNDKLPWQKNIYEPIGMVDNGFNSWDMGRKFALQSKNSALVIYKPKAFASKQVTSMRLGILFPNKCSNSIEEIWFGNEKVDTRNGVSKDPCSIYIRDGLVYMAIHPLTLTNYGRQAAVTVEHSANGYVLLSLYNYFGEPKDFASRGFVLTQNGFAFEIRDQSQYRSFEDFRKEMEAFTIEDRLLTNAHVRQTYQRKVKYLHNETALECEFSPNSECIRYELINGKLPLKEKLRSTGLDTDKLPFM